MKDLTETPTFDTPITVPEGDDWMDTLAEDIEAIAQKLANRTAAMKEVTDHAARTESANHFTVTQLSDVADCSTPQWSTEKGPHDHPSIPANRWKEISKWKILPSQYARLYVGDGTVAKIALVTNATWLASSAKWHLDDASNDARIFYLDDAGLWRVAGKDAGAADFASFDVTKGGLFSENIAATSLSASDIIECLTDITALGNVTGHTVRSAIGFKFVTPIVQTSIIDLTCAIGAVKYNSDGSISPAVSGGTAIAIRVRLPQTSSMGDIKIMHTQDTAAADSFALLSRKDATWDPGAPSAPTTGDDLLVNATSATGLKITTLHASGFEYDPTQQELQIVWRTNASGAVTNKVVQIRMESWTDYGPRND